MMKLFINGIACEIATEENTPLLWVIRDTLGLTGTKFGCGIGSCGACTVLINSRAQRSCQVAVGKVKDAHVVTIEGLSGDRSHPLQRAWIAEQVPQCGYCQSGMMMAAAALLLVNQNPTDADIDKSITNICRCGTYQRIRAAIHRAAIA